MDVFGRCRWQHTERRLAVILTFLDFLQAKQALMAVQLVMEEACLLSQQNCILSLSPDVI